ncbi:VC0807 family protein [Lentibacillus juripiscarius]|uniref:VC0807 family protein n=1 Tax=Lentibacillus juripiscarius TaxID=257446 RepID=A0ABW5VD12_9BACI
MNKRLMFLDLICYGAIPFLIWNYGREPLGDYAAILLSTVPGFIYTVYRFIKEKQLNIAGLFVITSLFISTAVNLLSTSANDMLWNQVYLGFVFGMVFLISTIIKKPLALYFAVDVAYLQGYPREDSRKLYKSKGLFIWFQLINLLFVFRGLFLNSLKAFLIKSYGVDGYDKVIIYMNISGWVFSGLIFLSFLFVSNKIAQYLDQLGNKKRESSVNTDT